jgi:hypothetical protein
VRFYQGDIILEHKKRVSFTKMDRKRVVMATNDVLDEQDIKYWSNASLKERLQTITYLRECFYGAEATTGRLQRFYKMFKLK